MSPTSVRYPKGIIAHWDLTSATHFNVSFYAENPNLGFQNQSPWIRIGNYDGDYMQFQASSDILNQARNQWRIYSIPLTGDTTWSRTDVGTPDLTDINYIEIHADTWGYGFKLWVDGVSFTPQPEPLDTDGDEYSEEMRREFQRRRDTMLAILQKPGFQCHPTCATFYVWVKVPPPWKSMDFALHALEKADVLVTPGVGFGEGGEGFFRIALTRPIDRLVEAGARLEQLAGP